MADGGSSFEPCIRQRLIDRLRTVAADLDALDDLSATRIADAIGGDDISRDALDELAGDRDAVRKLAASYRYVADTIGGDA